jgi:hypothetical protein
MVRSIKKAAGSKSAPQSPEVMPAPDNKDPQKVLTVRIDISVGADDPRLFEDFEREIKEAVLARNPGALVTKMGGYYLVGGKVCLPDDYDPETKDFKKGKFPPAWAGGPTESEIRARIAREQGLPALARNPANLLTAKETDALHAAGGGRRSRLETPGAAMKDFYENTERGREIVAEREERIKNATIDRVGAGDDEEDYDFVDDDDEAAFEVSDIEDHDKMGALLAEEEEDIIASLSGDETYETVEDDEDLTAILDDEEGEEEEPDEAPPTISRRPKIVRSKPPQQSKVRRIKR